VLESEIKEAKSHQHDTPVSVQLQSGLQELHDVLPKLAAFSHVWAAISHDMRDISSVLKMQQTGVIDLVFDNRLNRLETMYTALSKALRKYQVSVY